MIYNESDIHCRLLSLERTMVYNFIQVNTTIKSKIHWKKIKQKQTKSMILILFINGILINAHSLVTDQFAQDHSIQDSMDGWIDGPCTIRRDCCWKCSSEPLAAAMVTLSPYSRPQVALLLFA